MTTLKIRRFKKKYKVHMLGIQNESIQPMQPKLTALGCPPKSTPTRRKISASRKKKYNNNNNNNNDDKNNNKTNQNTPNKDAIETAAEFARKNAALLRLLKQQGFEIFSDDDSDTNPSP